MHLNTCISYLQAQLTVHSRMTYHQMSSPWHKLLTVDDNEVVDDSAGVL